MKLIVKLAIVMAVFGVVSPFQDYSWHPSCIPPGYGRIWIRILTCGENLMLSYT
jgi:hypothetical protein